MKKRKWDDLDYQYMTEGSDKEGEKLIICRKLHWESTGNYWLNNGLHMYMQQQLEVYYYNMSDVIYSYRVKERTWLQNQQSKDYIRAV